MLRVLSFIAFWATVAGFVIGGFLLLIGEPTGKALLLLGSFCGLTFTALVLVKNPIVCFVMTLALGLALLRVFVLRGEMTNVLLQWVAYIVDTFPAPTFGILIGYFVLYFVGGDTEPQQHRQAPRYGGRQSRRSPYPPPEYDDEGYEDDIPPDPYQDIGRSRGYDDDPPPAREKEGLMQYRTRAAKIRGLLAKGTKASIAEAEQSLIGDEELEDFL